MRLLPRVPVQPDAEFRPSFEDEAIAQSIPRRFEQQARAHGDRPAIGWHRGRYDYASLNTTANRLARTILARHERSTEPVALLFDHGGDVLAAILAVLKAGRIYVVLDPRYPPERLRYMLENSGARLIVAHGNRLDDARRIGGPSVELIDFDSVDPGLSGDDLGGPSAPDSLAMILYTSGSTGRPKAVTHSHRNVLADVRNYTNGWGITARDRWLLVTSVGFAHSVRTIYGSLLNGAAVYPFDARAHGFGALETWLLDNDITIARGVPTFFRSFMATLDPDRVFPAVRVLSLGGESMLRADLEGFNRHFAPHCVLSHAFGPTECLTACWALIPHGTALGEGKVPIGYALRDKDVLLLDESRQEVRVGDVGEIAVRSRYLSQGYWRDADRTAAVFLPDPTGGDARIYLTGDLGVRAADGQLTHVGRRDFQVKVRGFRIDVSEVEDALRAVTGVREAVVVGRELAPGDQRLIAYFVASSTPPISGRRIREALSRVLPDYMIPSLFVALDAIPRTPNGKTDRLRLPLPPRGHRAPGVPVAVPGNAIESELATMWEEVLGLDEVSADDTFLDLGGDSLQAARITARLAEVFNVEVTAAALLAGGSVRDVAGLVAAALSERRDSGSRPEPPPAV